jgi:hypothetical protein
MNKNPIRKMHVGWTSPWSIGNKPKSIREWVAVCPKCKVAQRSVKSSPYYNTKNTRKGAKDALHYHMQTFH